MKTPRHALKLSLLAAVGVSLACAPVSAADTAERLVLEPYPGPPAWHTVTDKREGLQHLGEQIPVDQTLDAYRDILTDQAFPQNRHVSPSDFLKGLFSRVSGSCDGPWVNGPAVRTEGGYAVAYGQAYCGRQKGKPFGVTMFFKVIQGDDALYVVQRELRVPPHANGGMMTFSKDQLGEAQAMLARQNTADHYLLTSVYLCGPRATDTRCARQPSR
jgi:hypothetical protein